jgi:hypothetical protein
MQSRYYTKNDIQDYEPFTCAQFLESNVVASHHALCLTWKGLFVLLICPAQYGYLCLMERPIYPANSWTAIVVQNTDCFGMLY